MRSKTKGLCLMLLLALAAGGCGEQGPEEAGSGTVIELLEPVNDTATWEAVVRRDLYDAKVYSANIYPYTEEYTFARDVSFGHYAAQLGQKVEKGTPLVLADNSALEKKIKEKEEQIRDMEEEFLAYREDTEKALVEPEAEARRLLDIVEAYVDAEPEKYLPAPGPGTGQNNPSGGTEENPSGGTGQNNPSQEGAGTGQESAAPGGAGTGQEPVVSPEYLQWEKEYRRYEGDYRILDHKNNTIRLQLEQKTQLYELDLEYARRELEQMKKELGQGTIVSSMAGSVVAHSGRAEGNFVGEREVLIAVGDPERKLLRCGYINKVTIARAKDVYALIDGVRREVVYQPIDADEYARRSANKEKIFSTFELAQEWEDLSLGDFGVIVVVNDSRENVLSVPESAIHTDGAETFVYVKEGEESSAVGVETGMSDGVYTEILSGLEEGAWVLNGEARTPGEGRAQVERGSFKSHYSGKGYLTYPSCTYVRNPVTYGTVYFTEFQVSLYDHVEKGDVIATVRVQGDEVGMKRCQNRLDRLAEQTALLEKRDAEGNARAIAAKREEMAEIRKEMADRKADYETECIRADRSGIVVELMEYEPEDILEKDRAVAQIADENTCYIGLDNENQLLQYGNEVTVSYTDKEGHSGTTRGMVANLSEGGTSSALKADYSMILLPAEAVENIPAVIDNHNGWWSMNYCSVEADIREMDNILLVPRKAVWESEGNTYVHIVREDGTTAAQSFLAGGYNETYYWVVEGLEEGMELCIK